MLCLEWTPDIKEDNNNLSNPFLNKKGSIGRDIRGRQIYAETVSHTLIISFYVNIANILVPGKGKKPFKENSII